MAYRFKSDGKYIPLAPIKGPGGPIDYGGDWSDWLDEGESIAESSWSVDGPDDALQVDASSSAGAIATVWLKGGTLGHRYTVTNSITTNLRSEQRSMYVLVDNK